MDKQENYVFLSVLSSPSSGVFWLDRGPGFRISGILGNVTVFYYNMFNNSIPIFSESNRRLEMAPHVLYAGGTVI